MNIITFIRERFYGREDFIYLPLVDPLPGGENVLDIAGETLQGRLYKACPEISDTNSYSLLGGKKCYLDRFDPENLEFVFKEFPGESPGEPEEFRMVDISKLQSFPL
jgi:hypothetical protein